MQLLTGQSRLGNDQELTCGWNHTSTVVRCAEKGIIDPFRFFDVLSKKGGSDADADPVYMQTVSPAVASEALSHVHSAGLAVCLKPNTQPLSSRSPTTRSTR